MDGVYRVFESAESPSIENRLARTKVYRRLQFNFLCGTPQLPLAQRKGDSCNQQRSNRHQPKPCTAQPGRHGLIIQPMTTLVALAFLAILGSLATALFFMMKDGTGGKAKTNNMARALAFRVGFSILLFACILIAWKLGYIQPTGLPVGK